MYKQIIDPISNKRFSIFSSQGKKLFSFRPNGSGTRMSAERSQQAAAFQNEIQNSNRHGLLQCTRASRTRKKRNDRVLGQARMA